MIKAICINDANRPNEIPESKWIKLGQSYTITKVFKMVFQDNILACELKEIDLSDNPYNCFRLDRFAIQEKDMEDMIRLMKVCGELNGLYLDKLITTI